MFLATLTVYQYKASLLIIDNAAAAISQPSYFKGLALVKRVTPSKIIMVPTIAKKYLILESLQFQIVHDHKGGHHQVPHQKV